MILVHCLKIINRHTDKPLIVEESIKLKEIPMENDHAYAMMGRLFGRNVITPRQLPVFKHEWLKPKHDDFQPRNMWSLYNSATEALKSCPPHRILEKHLKLHELFTEFIQ